MNRTALKNYAPQARRDFIQAMTNRAAFYGISAKKVEPMTVKGDIVVIGGREYPKSIADKRTRLEERIQRDGFNQTVDAVAYSWFNRFVALRYMELHGYLEHGYRVLSHPEGKPFPEILEHAEHLDLPTLDKNTVIDLKLVGNKENDLYRLLLLAQCNSLHASMPFLFEEINDETELLLPEGLLNSDSLIRMLVDGIAEEDWEKVEIIGWLYQYYISEKKDEVIGSVVASEDIPAATQLFTPNWIVRYLVQNTLGRKWLATYPESSIRGQMEFYIEPAEQEPEVQAKLKEITPEGLNPEEITFLDPACGSGHILVEAYDLFKAIYQERGYRTKDIPSLILQKNLFGFEIDDRAAQLSMFALLMKARADDRRILDGRVQSNIVCFVESKGLNPADLVNAINQDASEISSENISQFDICELVELFEHAKTFGSLIQVPPLLSNKLDAIEARLALIEKNNAFVWRSLRELPALVEQAKYLNSKYDVVVANPPYLGSKAMNFELKKRAQEKYPNSKNDLFSLFIERSFGLNKEIGLTGMVTMQSWMFLSSFEDLRKEIISKKTILCMAHLGQMGFDSLNSKVVQTVSFVNLNLNIKNFRSIFYRLLDGSNEGQKSNACLEAIKNRSCGWYFEAKQVEFEKITGSPIAYWISSVARDSFGRSSFDKWAISEGAVKTGNNAKFIRYLWEVRRLDIGPTQHWRLHPKGGEYRRWFGNLEFVVDWSESARNHYRDDHIARIPVETIWNIEGITWTAISNIEMSFRIKSEDEITNNASLFIYPRNKKMLMPLLCCLNSCTSSLFLKIISPTLNYLVGDILSIPFPDDFQRVSDTENLGKQMIELARLDWNNNETSFEFRFPPILKNKNKTIRLSQEGVEAESQIRFAQMKKLEEENNRIFIDAYGLNDELSPQIPDDQITLYRPDRQIDICCIISYCVGCIMGRFSLDKEGLIYAYSGNDRFDSGQYSTFPADDDGIVPLLNQDWGIPDDATERFSQFVSVVWPKENIDENLQFVAESLGGSPEESARDVIRNYFSTGFYKHHLQLYKRRPIYWLFSSGKQKAFQALVYLHRYNEGTLSRMRTEYVIPLQGKISGRIEQLEADKLKATSTSQRKKFQKEQDDLKKQQAELLVFDEKLKNYADQRIKLDLDDGVKVNYGKFGDLLAEVKAVTGGSDE